MALIYAAPPQLYMPGGTTGQPNIRQASPLVPIADGAIVVFSAGTPAAGLFNLNNDFLPGDTISYSINGVVGSSPIVVTSLINDAVLALVADINAHTGTTAVTATQEPTPVGFVILLQANTPGTAGNSIAISITTTSAAGTVSASNTTLLGGSAVGPSGLSPAAANVASGIAGVAVMQSVKNYGGSINQQPAPTFAFGFTQEGDNWTLPLDASQTMYASLGGPASLEINLTAVTGWISGGTYQAYVGLAVGINIDPVTGFYVMDPNASNKVATIVQKLNGPSAGDVGDLGARVLVTFYPSVLVA